MSELHRWLYVSDCGLPSAWADTAVADIVKVSRARNASLDVTGALLFTGGHFVQYLEGPTGHLVALRASIERDPRHLDVRTIELGREESRRFSDWTLAYAGPSVFVSSEVEALLDGTSPSSDRLVHILQEFTS